MTSQKEAGAGSPESSRLAEFEAFSRSELPRLVEANLQAMAQAETKPIEAKLKELLVDIVRRCQSTVSQRWEMLDPSALPESRPQDVSGRINQAGTMDIGNLTAQVAPTVGQAEANLIPNFYGEPPLLDDASLRIQLASLDSYLPTSDSGYEGIDYFCVCQGSKVGTQEDSSLSSSSQSSHSLGDSSWQFINPAHPIRYEAPSTRANSGAECASFFSRLDKQNRQVSKCSLCSGWRFES
jgi:hypothetical protein